MLKTSPFIKLISGIALAAVLTACDSGGVGTSANPELASASSFAYTGPAARNIDVANFQVYLYNKINDPSTNIESRCGGCHNSQADNPRSRFFFDTSNINVAYDESIAQVNLANPAASGFVNKMNIAPGHNCWETVSSFCGTLITGWIDDWANAASGGLASRSINLTIPSSIRDPGDAKSFPDSAFDVSTINSTSFATTVYPLLVGAAPFNIANNNCQNCHEETASGLPQAPFFASLDVESAYQAAKSKMSIDSPIDSRFAERLVQLHNCWTADCANGFPANYPAVQTSDAARMTKVIEDFADGILPTQIGIDLVTSKALTLSEGIVATGGSRHELDQFALWEFKTGTGLTAFDTSGINPATNLSLVGSVNWVGGYGLDFTGGRAQADPTSSDKIYSYIQTTGKYAIEAWVIPANVSQQDRNIVSYSGGPVERNFTLGQTLYNYEVFNRTNTPPVDLNGAPFLTTGENGEEIAQASLQHVVVNYDPFDTVNPGRSIYVNGQLISVTDPSPPGSVTNVWDDSMAFILGNEVSGNDRWWAGQIKMVALHNQPLNQAQIDQNYDVGVGQKFFLLFYVGQHLGETEPDPLNPLPNQDASFIMFEVAQFDSYSYLFNKPTFINLNSSWIPPGGGIDIEGMRIGINGKEAVAGQAYANLVANVNTGPDPEDYNPQTGQVLSSLGTIITLEKGPTSDEFFLTFEKFNLTDNQPYVDIDPPVPASYPGDPVVPPLMAESDIGMRTFEEVNLTIAEITGVPVTNPAVRSVYDDYLQQLPSTEAMDAFLPSHQMAVAQVALASCSELVEGNGTILPGPGLGTYFPTFTFSGAQSAFDTQPKRNAVINPILERAMNVVDPLAPPGSDNLTSQPLATDISAVLGSLSTQTLNTPPPANPLDLEYESLITQMLLNDNTDDMARTEQIVKALCTVAVGGAVMLVQ